MKLPVLSTIVEQVIFGLLALTVRLNDTYSTGRLHPGLPINLHWQGFHCPAVESLFNLITLP